MLRQSARGTKNGCRAARTILHSIEDVSRPERSRPSRCASASASSVALLTDYRAAFGENSDPNALSVREMPGPIACLENVAKARYLDRTQGFAMKAARYMTKAIAGKAAGRLFWRWPLALGLALAVAISLFHDLPAFAGRGDASPTSLAVASSTSAPVQPPDSQAPGHSCHCLCHVTAQAIASPMVTPVVFNESLYPPPQRVPPRSCAGLPPFPSPPRLKPAPEARPRRIRTVR